MMDGMAGMTDGSMANTTNSGTITTMMVGMAGMTDGLMADATKCWEYHDYDGWHVCDDEWMDGEVVV
jgi:hypothetical protein